MSNHHRAYVNVHCEWSVRGLNRLRVFRLTITNSQAPIRFSGVMSRYTRVLRQTVLKLSEEYPSTKNRQVRKPQRKVKIEPSKISEFSKFSLRSWPENSFAVDPKSSASLGWANYGIAIKTGYFFLDSLTGKIHEPYTQKVLRVGFGKFSELRSRSDIFPG